MAMVQRARAVVAGLAHTRFGDFVPAAADHVTNGVAAECIAAEKHDVHGKDNGSETNAELLATGRRIGPPQRKPDIPGEQEEKDDRDVGEVAMDVLQDQREPAFTPVARSTRFTDRA